MKRTAILLGLATVLLGSSELAAQARPSFAGNWTLVPDAAAPPPDAAGRGRGGRGGLFGIGDAPKITQDAAALTILTTTAAGDRKSVYNLDGSESKNSIMLPGRGDAAGTTLETVSKTKWDGNKLVIGTTLTVAANPIELTMALSLDASGNLVVETTTPGRQGGAPTTMKATYKKS